MTNELILERFELASYRIREIAEGECDVPSPFDSYFGDVSSFVVMILDYITTKSREEMTLEELADYNRMLYEDILEENYDKSYGNPGYAAASLGDGYGQLLSFLYSQIRGLIPFAYEYVAGDERRLTDIVIILEAFLEVYGCFGQDEEPSVRQIRDILYWFVSDYVDVTLMERVHEQLDPGMALIDPPYSMRPEDYATDGNLGFATQIVMESDLNDLRYLYSYGEYITENELGIARHLNTLTDAQIQSMADTFTEGYRIGFVMTGKDLSIKRTVNIRYSVGFERVVRAAINNFYAMGLVPVIYRYSVHLATGSFASRIGFTGAIANRQYDFDHKEDQALFLDKALVERKLSVLKLAYEEYKMLAAVHAGPAVMEVFGEKPFSPMTCDLIPGLDDKQQKLAASYTAKAGQIVNEYIKGEERSFTIIAYPIPEIGADFEDIFNETVKLNTLDYMTYQRIQQRIIDALDEGICVNIKGKSNNRTDLVVGLRTLDNPKEQTQFENCVADVNIPVGEVFTSPVLEGTNGTLNVSEVFLNGLKYTDLTIEFKDGYITKYSCSNQDEKYIKDNVLFHHDTLPMGEFAIGTNTTAYAMAVKYNIFDRLPILIAEKTGPHFAVGDTCYSHAEDVKVYNPDGKEIISRDNSRSLLRKDDPEKAYFGCHTDITIPYDELGSISVTRADGTETFIIRDGLFVLEGCRELNIPLENL